MTWNEVIEALGQEPEEEIEELDFVQEHKKIPVTLQTPMFLSKKAQKAYEDFSYDKMFVEIEKFNRLQAEYKEQTLAEIITKYDFIVGSIECKDKLKEILPEGANIVCSPYIESPTTIYAIKKFDITDFCK
jgi:hypothetical protein